MPIPPLTKHGVLPAGIHPCTVHEAKRFAADGRRAQIWKKFNSFIGWIKPWGVFRVYYIDGSFVTDKPDPRDIDVVLELPAPKSGVLHAFDLRLLDQAYIKSKYMVHLWFWFHGAQNVNDFRLFFQYVRLGEARQRGLQPNDKKGILKLDL
jgi:hypothetical protein